MLGGLYGLLVGDAVGVPYEFHGPADLPPFERIDLDPPPGFPVAHSSVPPGTWSDDGAQALCLLASLLERGRLDLDDLGRRLVRWHDDGYLAVDGVVYDVGRQTGVAIRALRAGTPAERSGPSGDRDNGNGSLMRVLPLALWHRGSDDELIEDAARQSLVTHGHLRSRICCALYCLWARAVLTGVAAPWDHAVTRLRAYCGPHQDWSAELEAQVRPDAPPGGSGSGYVVDCLHSARLAAMEPTFEGAVRRAISLGYDTDTTAAVAGGIVGLRVGMRGIPAPWLARLAGRDLVDPLARDLVRQVRAPSD